MKEQLQQLVQLQAIDTRLIRLKRELDGIPARLAETEKVLDAARASEKRFQQLLEDLDKKKRERERDLDEAENRIKVLDGRLSEVKTNVEYQARLKEIEAAKVNVGAIEEEILAVMEEVEATAPQSRKVEEEFAEANKRWQATRAEVEEKGKQFEEEIRDLRARREKIAEKLDEASYEQYRHLMETRHGLAVVEIRDEICNGCNMTVPPQLYNEVRAEERILTCPECERILYYLNEGPVAGGS